MKISQYNWNWWFVLNIIGLIVGFMLGIAGKDTVANVVDIDDWEIQNVNATVGGIKIDDFGKFRNGFNEHGMESLSKVLDFYSRRDLITESLKTNKFLKKIYGDDIIIWDSIPKEDRRDMYKLLLDNGVELDDWIINQYELREDGL